MKRRIRYFHKECSTLRRILLIGQAAHLDLCTWSCILLGECLQPLPVVVIRQLTIITIHDPCSNYVLLVDTVRVQHPTLTLANSKDVMLAVAESCKQARNIHLAIYLAQGTLVIQNIRYELVYESLNLVASNLTVKHVPWIILEEGRGAHADFNPCQASTETLAHTMMECILVSCRAYDLCNSRANRMRRFTTDQVNDLFIELDIQHLATFAVLHRVLIAGGQVVVTTSDLDTLQTIKRDRVGGLVDESLFNCLLDKLLNMVVNHQSFLWNERAF